LCLRSLGVLAPRLEDAQLRDMLQKLCEKCTSSSKKEEEYRDIAVIGLKTVAQSVTDGQADVLIDIVMPTLVASVAAKVGQLVVGMKHLVNQRRQQLAAALIEACFHACKPAAQDSFEVANESMDITVTLLDRFGGVITAKGLQAKLQPALLPLLDDSRTALRKRTITCLCASTSLIQCACRRVPALLFTVQRACLMRKP
jgi:hypothetical protein